MHIWADFDIVIPYGAVGEVRLTCPQCSASRRKSHIRCLAVNTDQGTWFCHHCGWKGSLHGRTQHPYRPMAPVPSARRDERKRAALRQVWQQAHPIRSGDLVDLYLHLRGLSIAQWPTVLRTHPHLHYQYEDGTHTFYPAMLAMVTAPDGQAVSLHRTYLTAEGGKANVPSPKKLMSPAVPGATHGSAIRLYQPTDILAVAEGIETALAVHLATSLPVWATISASGMANLLVPDTVHLVVIGADNDAPGLKAAKALARRMLTEGHRVKILIPDTPRADWADSLEGTYA